MIFEDSYYWRSHSIFSLLFCLTLFGDTVTKPSLLSTSQIPQKLLKRLLKKRITLTTCQLDPYWYHVSTLNLCQCPLHLGWVKVNFNVTIRPHASFTATGLPPLLLGARIFLGMSCLPSQISSLVPPIDSIQGEAYIARIH